jgi:hypothetical protein
VLRLLLDLGLILAGLVILGWAARVCRARLRRLRERARLARDVEDALVQNAQGLILKVHGLVRHLPSHDPLRKRVEQALDRADEQLSDHRDRVEDLRAQALLDGELIQHHGPDTPASIASNAAEPPEQRPRPGWIGRMLRRLRAKRS